MMDATTSSRTSRGYQDVVAAARAFFAAEDWRETSHNDRTVTFRGRPRIPWYLLALIGAGLLAYVVPGVIIYLLYMQNGSRFTRVTVTATPVRGGTEVLLQHAAASKGLVLRFVGQLPPLEAWPRPQHTAEALPGLQLTLTGSGRA